jgi:CheY-like chemotaxis protein
MVHTDEQRLRQILINLLSNAIKFTREGKVTFTARWKNQIAEFEVADTGPGIAAVDQARIFEPFQRLQPMDGIQVPGTGLGLTITKLLTEIMGGEITVTSQVGDGSRFKVKLMLTAVERAQASVQAPALRPISGYVGERRTVMIVDDDPTHRRLIADMLGPLGLIVIEAADAEAGLQLAALTPPDLFLLDIRMPGMNGWDMARQLRTMGFTTTPIVIVSATLRELEEPPGDATSHDDVLPKPIDLATLLDKVGRHLRIEWTAWEPPAEPALPEAPLLSAQQLAELRQLAAIGYVRGIRTRLEALEQEFTVARPFLGQLKALIADYRLDAFTAALDKAEAELAALEQAPMARRA